MRSLASRQWWLLVRKRCEQDGTFLEVTSHHSDTFRRADSVAPSRQRVLGTRQRPEWSRPYQSQQCPRKRPRLVKQLGSLIGQATQTTHGKLGLVSDQMPNVS